MTDQKIRKSISGTTPFLFDLYRQYNGDKSTTMSPISIMLLMSILANGASGETKKEIMRALGVSGLCVQDLNAICRTLIRELPLSISNRIDVYNRIKLSDDFINVMHDTYKATITEGLNIDGVTLVNSVRFCKKWMKAFDEEYTAVETFYGNASNENVNMMSQRDLFYYMSDKDYSAVDLPYRGSRYCMRIILPNPNVDIAKITDMLGNEMLEYIPSQMDLCEVELKIPKFRIDTDVSLSKAIQKFGASSMFDDIKANFSNMSEAPLFVSDIRQKAYVDVNEYGTEAYAETRCCLVGSAPNSSKYREVEFHANRPFIYMLIDECFSAIIFLGQFMGNTR